MNNKLKIYIYKYKINKNNLINNVTQIYHKY